MIMTVQKLRQYIDTDLPDAILESKLKSIELSIRNATNNNFQKRNFRVVCPVIGQMLYVNTPFFSVGDTVEISKSKFNDGIYVITEVQEDFIKLDRRLMDESDVMATIVEYPEDVVQGAVDMLRWKIRNESASNGDTSKMDVQSETLSRYSVTYKTDSTESDISEAFGVPKKLVAFVDHHRKARF